MLILAQDMIIRTSLEWKKIITMVICRDIRCKKKLYNKSGEMNRTLSILPNIHIIGHYRIIFVDKKGSFLWKWTQPTQSIMEKNEHFIIYVMIKTGYFGVYVVIMIFFGVLFVFKMKEIVKIKESWWEK